MTTDICLIEFWKDYLFIVTASGSIIGGRLCNDSDPNSALNKDSIIMRLTEEKEISVENIDLDSLARKIIKDEGKDGSYVFNNYVLAVNPDNNNMLGVYNCAGSKYIINEAIHESNFIVSSDWNSRQGKIKFIRYLHRMKSYANDKTGDS